MKKKIPKGWVKISKFEALTGLNNRTVTLAITRGSIPAEHWQRIGEGKTSPIFINPQPAALHWYKHINANHHLTAPLREKLAAYIRTFDPDTIAEPKKDKKKPTKKKNAKDETDPNSTTMAEAQRRKEVAKAESAELDLLEKKGILIQKQNVQDQLFNAGKELRTALLAIPDRITDEIIAASDNRTKVNNIIYDAIAGELQRLADLHIK